MARRLPVIIVAIALLSAACSSEAAPTTTVAVATTTTTTQPPTTTTTTTTEPPTTTTFTIPYAALDVSIEEDESAGLVVQSLYAWLGDRTLPTPDVPQGLLDHLARAHADGH